MGEVEYARPEDYARLAELEKLCFSQPWSEEAFASFAENNGFTLLFREKDEILGYVSAFAVADEGEIANVAVLPEARRQGVASRLLDAAEEEIRARGGRTLYLDVRVSNAGAVALYEKKGFVRVGSRRGFYQEPKEDSFIYRKDIV